MTTDAELWQFRSLVFDAQRLDKRAKALPKLVEMLRSDYRCSPDDQKALADFLDKKKRGRPRKAVPSPRGGDVKKAVQEIRQIQEGGAKRSLAIELFRMRLHDRMGEEPAERYFSETLQGENRQLDAALRRAKPRK